MKAGRLGRARQAIRRPAQPTSWQTRPAALLGNARPTTRMQICQVFHLKVRSLWITPVSVLILQTPDAIRHLEWHNLFL